MNAVAPPPITTQKNALNSLRQWISELTDYTPQQVELIATHLERQQHNQPTPQS